MNSSLIFGIFISLVFHLLLVIDLSIKSEAEVTMKMSSSKSSFKVNLNKEKKSPKRKGIGQNKKVSNEVKADESNLAKTSVHVANQFKPQYPYRSRLFSEEGIVFVNVKIDKSAKVIDASIAKSSGFKRLDNAALEAARKSFFTVTQKGRESVVEYVLEFNFKLNEGE